MVKLRGLALGAEIEAFARWLEEMGLGDIFFKPAYIQYAEER